METRTPLCSARRRQAASRSVQVRRRAEPANPRAPQARPHPLICLALAILCHWDGVWETYGPDTWKASIKGGPTLLETTFSNFSRVQQNYPDEAGFSTFPFQTAAASVGDLGFVEELGERKGGWNNLDATYRIWLAASHSDPTVTFNFSGDFHDDPDQIDDWGDAGENWAVKSCRVWAVPAGNVPDGETRTLAAASLVSAPGKAPDPAAHAVLVLSGAEAFPEITAALREASNGTDVAARIASSCGVRVEIIDQTEEARLAWIGAREVPASVRGRAP